MSSSTASQDEQLNSRHRRSKSIQMDKEIDEFESILANSVSKTTSLSRNDTTTFQFQVSRLATEREGSFDGSVIINDVDSPTSIPHITGPSSKKPVDSHRVTGGGKPKAGKALEHSSASVPSVHAAKWKNPGRRPESKPAGKSSGGKQQEPGPGAAGMDKIRQKAAEIMARSLSMGSQQSLQPKSTKGHSYHPGSQSHPYSQSKTSKSPSDAKSSLASHHVAPKSSTQHRSMEFPRKQNQEATQKLLDSSRHGPWKSDCFDIQSKGRKGVTSPRNNPLREKEAAMAASRVQRSKSMGSKEGSGHGAIRVASAAGDELAPRTIPLARVLYPSATLPEHNRTASYGSIVNENDSGKQLAAADKPSKEREDGAEPPKDESEDAKEVEIVNEGADDDEAGSVVICDVESDVEDAREAGGGDDAARSAPDEEVKDSAVLGQEVGADVARPDCRVVVHNVAKRHNVGTLVRSAVAFGAVEMVMVGRRDFNAFGSHGSVDHIKFKHCHSLDDAREYLKSLGCHICGVEITPTARSVQSRPFHGSTAFLLGNEGSGLSEKEMKICDSFVYIPQHGVGTASLNVAVAASIILHHFAVWAEYPETGREGQKFIVAEKPVRRTARNVCPEDPDEVAQRRSERDELAEKDWLDEDDDGCKVLGM